MHTYLSVVPGVNLTRALGSNRLTKVWVREMMRTQPDWDWRIMTTGQAVNGEDCIRQGDVTLQVMAVRNGGWSTIAMVNFKPDARAAVGYKAVVS